MKIQLKQQILLRNSAASIDNKKDKRLPYKLALHPLDITCIAHVAHVAKLSVTKVFNRTQLKILTLKQIFQTLPIALAQIKAGNISENLVNKIRKIIYSQYREKEITKKVYNKTMNSIKL